MEVRETAPDDLGSDLDRIEAAVAAGSTDLRGLGFWRVVATVKPDRLLIGRYADQIGRIDTAAFRAGVKLKVPVWVGNALLLLGAVVGGLAVWAAYAWTTPLCFPSLIAAGRSGRGGRRPTAGGLLIGIRWTDYFPGGSPPPARAEVGLRQPARRPRFACWMYASGAIATKFAVRSAAFWPIRGAPGWLRPC